MRASFMCTVKGEALDHGHKNLSATYFSFLPHHGNPRKRAMAAGLKEKANKQLR